MIGIGAGGSDGATAGGVTGFEGVVGGGTAGNAGALWVSRRDASMLPIIDRKTSVDATVFIMMTVGSPGKEVDNEMNG